MSNVESVSLSIRVSVGEWDNALSVTLLDNNEVHIDGAIAIEPDDAEEFAKQLTHAIREVLKGGE